jgi:type II secretory pathway component PulF
MQLTLPVTKNLAEGIYISRFSRTMQMLLGAGVPLLDALKTCSSMMRNDLYEDGILAVTDKVEKGVPLSTELLKNPIFPPLLGQMAAVGEETGQLDGVMGRIADYYEEDASERIKVISSLIEPIVLLIIGCGVAFLVFAILVPVYNLTKVS